MNETNIIIVKSAQAVGPYTTNFNGAGQSYSPRPSLGCFMRVDCGVCNRVFLGFYFGKNWRNSN